MCILFDLYGPPYELPLLRLCKQNFSSSDVLRPAPIDFGVKKWANHSKHVFLMLLDTTYSSF